MNKADRLGELLHAYEANSGILDTQHMWDLVDLLKADREALQATIDKLPKTADGVVITEGTTLYGHDDSHCPITATVGECKTTMYLIDPKPFPVSAANGWHSTAEAALAAKEQN